MRIACQTRAGENEIFLGQLGLSALGGTRGRRKGKKNIKLK